ncbi:MAG: hypothetical protein H6741_13360 [Alphaproteobacteria bacterium]|nr:hypothetical protein [Alphaproteobacteria bacterium]MCB9793704.1 hypothetical protein [Alphaproteobacteria bacterium]
MDPLRALRNRAVTRLQSLPRRLTRRVRGGPGEVQALPLRSTAGYRLSATLHLPSGPGPHPAVLLCPGTNAPGSVFTGWTEPLNAGELAAAGVAALRFDPAGRGDSMGAEDYGGPEHQDEVRVALKALLAHPAVDPGRVGVVSISLGLAMAVGALARWPEELPVRFLLDWEGPCDREIITAGGTRMAPALGHGLDDDFYWHPREATRHVGRLRCGYVRVQSERDHAQPGELRHATRMIEAAARGQLPWFRLNEHPPGELPAAPEWYPGGRNAANRVLMSWIRRLTS